MAIWAYALVSGLLAFGLIKIIALLAHSNAVPLVLQLTIMLVVAVVAGLACLGVLTRVRYAAPVHRHDRGRVINGQ